MAKVITDLAKLNKAMLTPVEKPKETPAVSVEDDGSEAMEYFGAKDDLIGPASGGHSVAGENF